ncbi:hypothetical protein EB796_022183 [Bugula neritina]|uniref:Uncharacterized protein n=1 Tax=Bugula neritina TaxID=10212 RepID=A0A7J7J031_BUGNE|nr:hypothetical protein EB796_022183 [Bugula neritina]
MADINHVDGRIKRSRKPSQKLIEHFETIKPDLTQITVQSPPQTVELPAPSSDDVREQLTPDNPNLAATGDAAVL